MTRETAQLKAVDCAPPPLSWWFLQNGRNKRLPAQSSPKVVPPALGFPEDFQPLYCLQADASWFFGLNARSIRIWSNMDHVDIVLCISMSITLLLRVAGLEIWFGLRPRTADVLGVLEVAWPAESGALVLGFWGFAVRRGGILTIEVVCGERMTLR